MQDIDYRIEIDSITPSKWAESIDRFDDANIYQTWSYGAVRWGRKNLSHLVLKRNGETVAMAQLRIVRPFHFKIGMAHLRWGPLCHPKGSELDPEIVRTMASALHEEYVKNRGLFLRILPNGNMGSPRAQVFQSAFSQYRSESFGPGDSFRTFVLDLTPSLEVLRKRLAQKWRNQLNCAEKNGLTIREDDGCHGFRTFTALYGEMWARKQFAASSNIREFERLQQDLPQGQQMKVFICEHEGVPAAGLIGTGIGNAGIYLLGATNEQGMKSKGAYLLQWRMIQWLKETGVRYYNLGGINSITNPGVYHFKKGLSGQETFYMNPLVSYSNVLSCAFAKTGHIVRGQFGSYFNRLIGRR